MGAKIKGNIPLRPPRIVLIYPPGFGYDKLTNGIATKYGLTGIEVSTLIKREIESKSKIGGILSRLAEMKEASNIDCTHNDSF